MQKHGWVAEAPTMTPQTVHRYEQKLSQFLCEICNEQKAVMRCEACDRVVCKNCGGLYRPTDEMLCIPCQDFEEKKREEGV